MKPAVNENGLRSAIYEGTVMHRRMRPIGHQFSYRVFSLLLDLDELPLIAQRQRLLRIERPGIVSFKTADHGSRDGSALRPWAERELEAGGIGDVARIELLCFPRLWGYVFNPLSVYFAYDEADRLQGVLYEVKNTFGGQHTYVLPATGTAMGEDGRIRHSARKTFYVSPFIDMAATYNFSLRAPGDELELVIRETDDSGPFFVASQTGRRRPLDDRHLTLCLLRNPTMTLKVIGGIHVEALRLWLKGAPYHPQEAERVEGPAHLGG